MLTRIDNEQPPTFIRKCKVNLPTLKFDILRRGKKLRNDPLFSLLRSSHYFVNCQNRTTDFMVLCLVFLHKFFQQKKEKQDFYNFSTFAVEWFVVFKVIYKFKISFMYCKKGG